MNPDVLRRCPACGADLVAGAARCSNCGEDFVTAGASEPAVTTLPKSTRHTGDPRHHDKSAAPASQQRREGKVTLDGTVNRFQSRPVEQLEAWTFSLEPAAPDLRASSV